MVGPELSRQEFLKSTLIAAAAGAAGIARANPPQEGITLDDLKSAEKLFGLSFTEKEREEVLAAVLQARRTYDAIRATDISYVVEPPMAFKPLAPLETVPAKVEAKASKVDGIRRPVNLEDLAYLTVRELAHLVRTRQVSPVELTEMYLRRIERYGERLLNIVTPTPERARAHAREAELEIGRGKYRGPLHGIPYGLKDLFATKGYKTTWGSEPHKDQTFDYDAAVVEKLDAAGAILVAKTSLGALAMGDVWFKGRTKNPWNEARGSSGSSAGSASGVAAGLFAFAIGTETLGSIMSPSHECRVTGLRPTYGRVSRYGGMAVSWSMDKVGPICREAEDCALVLAALCGADPRDRTAVDRSFVWTGPPVDLKRIKIGYLIGAREDLNDLSRLEQDDYLKTLVALGAKPRPVKFDPLPAGVNLILGVEAAAAFDEFTRSERIGLLTNSAWPLTYRQNRYVPAVEYLRAQRLRSIAMRRFDEQWGDLDVVVANERGAALLVTTNYTGHPQVLVPNGVDGNGNARSISFFGKPYQEALILGVAKLYQQATGVYRRHPEL
jgi:Asp-tRNA(Asn)/Glu-tRNA(Gln) amidotransferase A subunit family amidase